MYRPPAEREFYQKLAEARRLLAEMERTVGLFAQKLDAAGDGESLEVDADLDTIETLIWKHNDVLESARDLWLREDLEGDTYNQLAIMSDPTSVGLPRFIDDDQPRRAKVQWERISARLDQRIAFLDDVIYAMEKIEQAGTIAGFLLGGGILFQAAKQGGKVLLVKTVAMAASMAASAVVGKATGAALKAIGVEEETVEKVQNAAELISWLLILRRMKLVKSRGPTQTDRKASPDGKQEDPTSERPQNSETPKVKEPLLVDKQPGTGLMPAAPVELGKWGEARLRLYLGGKGFKPRSAFKTSRGKRFVDWMLDGIAHEAKAGINVKLTRNLAVRPIKMQN